MVSRTLTWLAAGSLVLLICGCAARRERVTIVAPTFSYVDSGPMAAAALWPDTVRDTVSVQAALAD